VSAPGLRGHLCPDCAEAVDAEDGAVGASALNRAVLDSLSKAKRRRLRALLEDGLVLTAWGSLPAPRVPNATRFGHLRSRVLDRL
jgi:hypothetical protein